jgi:hypothetical protein
MTLAICGKLKYCSKLLLYLTVRWLSVDGHSVDSHYVVCHLGRIALQKSSMSLVVYIALLYENTIQMSLRSHCIIRSHPYIYKA